MPAESSEPYVQIFQINKPEGIVISDPGALETQLTLISQIRQDESTIVWGLDDALPLKILTAIAKSPTTTACIGKLEMFTKGSEFTDAGLMNMVINNDGMTLWEHHCENVAYLVALDGFATNFKYSNGGKILQVFGLPAESCRLKSQIESTTITGLKFNPYFGTKDYQIRFTTEYSLFDPSKVKKESGTQGTNYNGQAYFYGKKNRLYKHYPVPKYWSAERYIYADAKLGEYSDELLSNGFFQSVLMTVIGDPNKISKHPSSMKNVVGSDNITRKEPTKTEGQVFGESMATNFSGVKRAGTVMVQWAMNKDQIPNVQSFPNNNNFDQTNGTLLNAIRMISLATEMPGILVNLPDTASPLSGQDALPKAIDFAQANTAPNRAILENYYNNILIPNLQSSTKARVQIKQYMPAKVSVTIDQYIWAVMTTKEKRDYVKEHTDFNITAVDPTVINPMADHLSAPLVIDPVPVDPNAPPTTDGTIVVDPSAPSAPQIDENLKNMKVAEIKRIGSIVKQYETGKLTIEQAKQLLAGYGLTEEQQTAWINPLL